MSVLEVLTDRSTFQSPLRPKEEFYKNHKNFGNNKFYCEKRLNLTLTNGLAEEFILEKRGIISNYWRLGIFLIRFTLLDSVIRQSGDEGRGQLKKKIPGSTFRRENAPAGYSDNGRTFLCNKNSINLNS
ncbi:hypothetical protein AVEN_39331-1 [Araneus ventricosus]|uniref:Uncharacterized protein n=1 Tax=Araneus ventricosus TaxID=182803 RepID=A0A4Y2SVH8_ARAVE|nr:hypothetical protein AVEN_39331-1 [Araneus ventricosus]